MSGTDAFYNWFYYGLNGLGGWFLFFLAALIAVVWLIYNGQSRRLPAPGWRLGAILTAALLLPAILWRFSSLTTQDSLSTFREWIFYLGLLGGVVPVALAVGFYITFQGMVGCANGHVYEASLGDCPECARQAAMAASPPAPVAAAPPPQPAAPSPAPAAPPPPSAPKAQAWLTSEDGRSYQLNAGETSLGRGSQSDVRLTGDSTVSRQHAKIVMEPNGRFRLYDLGSTTGTRVNGRLLRQPELLEPNDTIQLGDNTRLRFVTGG
jgi:hypothetical protein